MRETVYFLYTGTAILILQSELIRLCPTFRGVTLK